MSYGPANTGRSRERNRAGGVGLRTRFAIRPVAPITLDDVAGDSGPVVVAWDTGGVPCDRFQVTVFDETGAVLAVSPDLVLSSGQQSKRSFQYTLESFVVPNAAILVRVRYRYGSGVWYSSARDIEVIRPVVVPPIGPPIDPPVDPQPSAETRRFVATQDVIDNGYRLPCVVVDPQDSTLIAHNAGDRVGGYGIDYAITGDLLEFVGDLKSVVSIGNEFTIEADWPLVVDADPASIAIQGTDWTAEPVDPANPTPDPASIALQGADWTTTPAPEPDPPAEPEPATITLQGADWTNTPPPPEPQPDPTIEVEGDWVDA